MHFYTSANINYLPKARVLAKSVKRYCKNARFSLVFSDEIPPEFKIQNEPFDEILTIDQLGIPVDNLYLWIFIHTVVELCTAVKGQALVKFLEQGSEKVVYLDPDIVVYHSLDEIEQLLNEYDILLTPHITTPERTKRDIVNNEICALRHGIYNFGFYAVKNSVNGRKFAHWWRDRLVDYCFDDIPNGLFTDQRWGDFVPALFDGVHILKDPGYNVATWNITTRRVTKDVGGNYLVNGNPLKFYHFSGFDSGAQKIMLDLNDGGNPALYELREWYIEEMEKEGQSYFASLKSTFNYYSNGHIISKEQRITLRNRDDLLKRFSDVNPFLVDQPQSFYMWCFYAHGLMWYLRRKFNKNNG